MTQSTESRSTKWISLELAGFFLAFVVLVAADDPIQVMPAGLGAVAFIALWMTRQEGTP